MRRFISGHKLLVGIELLGMIICLLFCFRPEKLIFSADADAIADRLHIDESGNYYLSDLFTLHPGVYRLRMYCRDHEGILYPSVGAVESSFQALRSNGAPALAHRREIDIEAYVIDKVGSAYVICNYIGEAGQPVEGIELYRTSAGWRMLTFILLLANTGINLLIWLREKILRGAFSIEQGTVAAVLALSVLLAYLPYCTDYMNLGADGAFHLLRIEGLRETLLHGQQFPVRVQEYWLYGHGYAVSSFYGDLFLFFPALLRLIGFSLMDAYKFFVFAVLVGTAVIAYCSFYRCTGSRYGALLGSVLYELAPYHIYNIYNRNAVGEYLGMMFLPMVICGFYRIYTQDEKKQDYRGAKVPLIIGLSGILQSHILTCEMTVVVLALAALVMWRKTFRKETLWELVKAAVVFMLVNAWFWIPLLKMLVVDEYKLGDIVTQDIQYMGTRIAGILQMYPYMGGGQTEMYNCEPIQIGAALWAVPLCYIAVRLCRREKSAANPYDKVMKWGTLLGVLSLFLSTRYFPWDMVAQIPGVGLLATAIQFPTRLLAIATLFISFMAAFFVPWLREESAHWKVQNASMVMAGSMVAIVVIALWATLYHVNEISYNLGPIRLYTAENMGNISVVNGEYLLKGMDVQQMQYHDPIADEGLLWGDYDKKGLTINLYVENQTSQELYMELPLTGYRGYGIDADGEMAVPYISEERGAHGDLRIAIPSGYAGNIRVAYKGFLLFRVAEGISGATVLLWLGIGLVKRYRKVRKISRG
ncbi:MAG: hypothetical protein HDR02_15235 [Lachnospiraceae bacterium]|nr:hypothetical protein [Lachnospiraceae bacterium]